MVVVGDRLLLYVYYYRLLLGQGELLLLSRVALLAEELLVERVDLLVQLLLCLL